MNTLKNRCDNKLLSGKPFIWILFVRQQCFYSVHKICSFTTVLKNLSKYCLYESHQLPTENRSNFNKQYDSTFVICNRQLYREFLYYRQNLKIKRYETFALQKPYLITLKSVYFPDMEAQRLYNHTEEIKISCIREKSINLISVTRYMNLVLCRKILKLKLDIYWHY